jgi:hypothetical protein
VTFAWQWLWRIWSYVIKGDCFVLLCHVFLDSVWVIRYMLTHNEYYIHPLPLCHHRMFLSNLYSKILLKSFKRFHLWLKSESIYFTWWGGLLFETLHEGLSDNVLNGSCWEHIFVFKFKVFGQFWEYLKLLLPEPVTTLGTLLILNNFLCSVLLYIDFLHPTVCLLL